MCNYLDGVLKCAKVCDVFRRERLWSWKIYILMLTQHIPNLVHAEWVLTVAL